MQSRSLCGTIAFQDRLDAQLARQLIQRVSQHLLYRSAGNFGYLIIKRRRRGIQRDLKPLHAEIPPHRKPSYAKGIDRGEKKDKMKYAKQPKG